MVHARELAIWCTLLITGQFWRGKLRATPATLTMQPCKNIFHIQV
jgi:hypothetical protein